MQQQPNENFVSDFGSDCHIEYYASNQPNEPALRVISDLHPFVKSIQSFYEFLNACEGLNGTCYEVIKLDPNQDASAIKFKGDFKSKIVNLGHLIVYVAEADKKIKLPPEIELVLPTCIKYLNELGVDFFPESNSWCLVYVKNSLLDKIQNFVDEIRFILNSEDYKKIQTARKIKMDKNLVSCKTYVKNIFKKYSKVLVIRVDLGFKSNTNLRIPVNFKHDLSQEHSLECLKRIMSKFLNNKRHNKLLNEIIGYIFKYEYGFNKGFHVHAIFFFDGNKHLNDGYYANEIIKYWQKITNENGSSYNCNLVKDKYLSQGIGLIHYSEHEKINNLIICVQYLCKAEQFFIFETDEKFRVLQKGITPQAKSAAGRPRNYKLPLI